MTELASGKLLLDRPAEAVARLRLNNPEKRNPLDHEVLDAIAATLPELAEGIEIRCVVITGTGRAFSAGYDIGAIPDSTFEQRRGGARRPPVPRGDGGGQRPPLSGRGGDQRPLPRRRA